MRAGRARVVAVVAALVVGVLAVAAAPPAGADQNDAPTRTAFRGLSAGNAISCAITAAGALKCWGQNNADGALGQGDSNNRGDQPGEMGDALTAVPLGTGRSAVAVSSAGDHSCVLLDNASVKCFGWNGGGQLGQGDGSARGDSPGELGDALPAVDLGTGRTAVAVSANGSQSCAILDNAQLKCWGDNLFGQLGQGDGIRRGDGPGEMGDTLLPVDLGTGRTATAVATGRSHTCAVLDNGSVKCWGWNQFGQLGLGDTNNRGGGAGQMGDALPAVDLGSGRTAVAISAGFITTCALLDNGQVKCWGNNTSGQLGLGDTNARGDGPGEMGDALPAVDLGTGRTAVAISVGDTGPCALLDNGWVKCWGGNNAGQLGQGDTDNRGDGSNEMGDALLPIDLGTGRTAVAITGGNVHNCARLDDDSVKCWGDNNAGALGLGDTDARGDGPGEMGDALPEVVVVPVPELAVQLAGAPGSVAVGADLDYQLTVENTGNVDLTGVTGPTECAPVTATLAVGADDTVDCTYVPTLADLGTYALSRSASSTETSTVASNSVNVSVTAPTGQTAVKGRVTATIFGNSIGGALVMVLDPTTRRPVASATTGSDGRYTLLAPSGSGLLLVADPANAHISKLVSTTPTAFPDGGTVTADVQLTRYLGGIDGRITDSGSGSGIPGAIALAFDAATGHARAGEVADSFGFYVIRNLRSVAYDMTFLDPTGAHAAGSHPSPVNVVGGALQVIGTTTLTPRRAPSGSTVQGTVTAEGGGPVAEVAAVVRDAGTGEFEAAALTDGAGQYSVTVDSGQHTVQFVDLNGTYRSEVHDDRPDGEPADGDPVAAPATVDAALALAEGSLAGTVTEEGSGDPLEGVLVAAIDDAGIIATDLTGVDGTYSINDVPAGATRVWFADPALTYLPEYHDDRVRGFGQDAAATPVSVVGGETATVDAALGPFEAVDPSATITTPADGATVDRGEVVNADYACDDGGGSGIESCVGDVAEGSPIDTSVLGPQAFSVTATDRAGNSVTVTHDYTVVDRTDPSVTITTPADGASFAQGAVVNADFACADEVGGSGLASCVGPVADGSPIDTSTVGPHTFSVTATDSSANTATVTHNYTVVPPNAPVGDRTAPTVRIITPPVGATYYRTQVILAEYGCADEVGGSGLSTCVGDVPFGSPIDTSTPGEHTLSITATDAAGNRVKVTRTYTVVEAECLGRTVTVYLGLGDTPTNRGDVLLGTQGADTLVGLGGVDRVCGRGGPDTIRGGPGPDRIQGGAGGDALLGGAGPDVLRGGPGDDEIVGGPGNDTAWGGPGTDTCLLAPGRDVRQACENR